MELCITSSKGTHKNRKHRPQIADCSNNYVWLNKCIERHKFRAFYVKLLNSYGGQTLRHHFNITEKRLHETYATKRYIYSHRFFSQLILSLTLCRFVIGSNVYERFSFAAHPPSSHLPPRSLQNEMFHSCIHVFEPQCIRAICLRSRSLLNQQYWSLIMAMAIL